MQQNVQILFLTYCMTELDSVQQILFSKRLDLHKSSSLIEHGKNIFLDFLQDNFVKLHTARLDANYNIVLFME